MDSLGLRPCRALLLLAAAVGTSEEAAVDVTQVGAARLHQQPRWSRPSRTVLILLSRSQLLGLRELNNGT